MKECLIRDEFIELYKALKLANLAASGGEAKALIEEGQVRVNNAAETRKKKKLLPGDVVSCRGQSFVVKGPAAGA